MAKTNVAILGAGNIANSMAQALNGILDEVVPYAVAARDLSRAQEFAKKWNFTKAYGSYEELVSDPEVDLVYVATPHSHHYEHMMLCLEHGKAVLCEKAFTANLKQAKEVIALAEEKNIFLTEAIWTRYMPAKDIVWDAISNGAIGELTSVEAEFSVPLSHKERMYKPELAGGALLDLGMYALTFASMYLGEDIEKVESKCELFETGVDATSDIYYTYKNGKKAHLRTSMVTGPISEGTIYGTEGSICISPLNNYSSIRRLDKDGNLAEEYAIPVQVNGYEYEVLASIKAMREGKAECEEMTHAKTLELMRQMDELRAAWGVKYPFE